MKTNNKVTQLTILSILITHFAFSSMVKAEETVAPAAQAAGKNDKRVFNRGGGAGDASEVSTVIRVAHPELAEALKVAKRKDEYKKAKAEAKMLVQKYIGEALSLYRLLFALQTDFNDEVVEQFTPNKLDEMLRHFLSSDELPTYLFDISMAPIIEDGREMTFKSSPPNEYRKSRIRINWPKFSREVNESTNPSCNLNRLTDPRLTGTKWQPCATNAGLLSTLIHEGYVMAGVETSFDYAHSGRVGQFIEQLYQSDNTDAVVLLFNDMRESIFTNRTNRINFCDELGVVDDTAKWSDEPAYYPFGSMQRFRNFVAESNKLCINAEIPVWRSEIEKLAQNKDLAGLLAIERKIADQKREIDLRLSFPPKNVPVESLKDYSRRVQLNRRATLTEVYALLLKKVTAIQLEKLR